MFIYTDSQERIYPNIIVDGAVLVASPGQSYALDADPGDGRWESAVTPPVAPVAPEVDIPESTPTPSN